MGLFEITFLGVGLAMDAVAVSMTNGMAYKNLGIKEYIFMPLFFGVFQGVMPLLGYYGGTLFSDIIGNYGGIVIFIILAIIGGNMLKDGIFGDSKEERIKKKLTIMVLFFQAIATSLDAFAVGVGFSTIKTDIIPAVSIIAIVTAVMVIIAIFIGKKFGDIFEGKAEILGGIILIIIGIKALI